MNRPLTHADAITKLRAACGLYQHHADQGALAIRALQSFKVGADEALRGTASLLSDDLAREIGDRATPSAKRTHAGVVRALRELV